MWCTKSEGELIALLIFILFNLLLLRTPFLLVGTGFVPAVKTCVLQCYTVELLQTFYPLNM